MQIYPQKDVRKSSPTGESTGITIVKTTKSRPSLLKEERHHELQLHNAIYSIVNSYKIYYIRAGKVSQVG